MYNIIHLFFNDNYSTYNLTKKYNVGMQRLNVYVNSILREIIYLKNGKFHRENKPAQVEYYLNGNIKSENYYINGGYYREDGPAIKEYYENGDIKYIEYCRGYIHLYKKNTPFAIGYYENNNVKELYYYNVNNGENGMKIIEYYENKTIKVKEYYSNSRYHREGEPAVIKYYADGSVQLEEYYINGLLHREDGPAQIYYFDNIHRQNYYINDKDIYMAQFNYLTYDKINNLIIECKDINNLLELKLAVNVKFNKNKKLLDLIESKLIMLKLI